MLSTKEKICFGVLSALFFVPELMWGMVSKYWLSGILGKPEMLSQLEIWFDKTTAPFYSGILLIQFLSLLSLVILTLVKRQKIKGYALILILELVLLISCVLVLLVSFVSYTGTISIS
jgi:hypothetical protein